MTIRGGKFIEKVISGTAGRQASRSSSGRLTQTPPTTAAIIIAACFGAN